MREPDTHRTNPAGLEPDAFTALYEQYAARIFTYLQYRCDDPTSAQDLTAQVFERVLHRLPDYEAGRAPVVAWIFGITRHVFADWQRRNYFRRLIPWENISQQPSTDPGPEQAAVESEERQQLRRALRQLSSRERDLLGLRFSSGLTNRAIAELTGLSESNVAVIIYRALRKLHQHMIRPVDVLCLNPTAMAEVDHE